MSPRITNFAVPSGERPLRSGRGVLPRQVVSNASRRDSYRGSYRVLHAFKKKSRQTAKMDIELAKARYRLIGDKP
jgi:hypothetical protein